MSIGKESMRHSCIDYNLTFYILLPSTSASLRLTGNTLTSVSATCYTQSISTSCLLILFLPPQKGESHPTRYRFDSLDRFFAMAARQMRHVLVDYARKRKAEKRGGEAIKFSLEDVDGAREYDPDELRGVHVAFEKLEAFDAHLVELKHFAGLTDHEIAYATGISFARSGATGILRGRGFEIPAALRG